MNPNPFISTDEAFVSIVRACFDSGQLSPHLLNEATGVDIDLCIEFCSYHFAEAVCRDDSEEEE